MAIRWSSIHEQLGEQPRDLDYALIEAAVEQGVIETESLDWKQVLPSSDEKQLEEFAKDVAAMANTRGGLIVYGVAEQRGKGSASVIADVDASEGSQRRLRQIAAKRVEQPVAGIDFVPLTSPDGSLSVLVMSVPRSADAPHIIGDRRSIGVPFRDGSETFWMRERDLERAYSERFTRRTSLAARLFELIDHASDQLDLSKVWAVAAASPTSPLGVVVSPPSRDDTRRTMEDALRRAQEVTAQAADLGRWMPLKDLRDAALNPRVGLRRWVIREVTPESRDVAAYGLVELHHDGSALMAYQCEETGGERVLPEGPHEVMTGMVEGFAADFVALVDAHARQRGVQAPMAYRAELMRADNSNPMAAVGLSRTMGGRPIGYDRVAASRTVRRFHPVMGEVPVAGEMEALREVSMDLARDVLHQFGVADLLFLAR
ncbi:AlbA family DNA-binding domain-containing protein [Micromonospora matsumotoense]|uniref:AlbA family DNA-binding domain-containing protein n=1 Tax=Micromonospora matsumotoense TaxID=121616 RepID=UPI00341047C7